MEKLIESQLLERFNSYRPMQIGSSLPIAIIAILKPVVARFIDKVKELKEDEEFSLDSLKSVVFSRLSNEERDQLSSGIQDAFAPMLRNINRPKESSSLYEDETVKDSLKNHFFPAMHEFNEKHELLITHFIDWLFQDLMDSCIAPYIDNHIPMKYIHAIGTSICEDDSNFEDENDNPWRYYLTSSFLYSLILFDEFSSLIYFPNLYKKMMNPDQNQTLSSSSIMMMIKEELPFLFINNDIPESKYLQFEEELLQPILLKIIEGMRSSFDHYLPSFTEVPDNIIHETRQQKLFRQQQKEIYLKLVSCFRLFDDDYLTHYQNLLLSQFPWKKLFSPSSPSDDGEEEDRQEGDYLWDKVEYPDITENYISGNNLFAPSCVFKRIDKKLDEDDDSFHETWPRLATFLRIVQEIFFLYDFTHQVAATDGGVSSYEQWIRIIEEIFPLACAPKYLFLLLPNANGDDEEKLRLKARILFVSLSQSIFSISYSSCSSMELKENIEKFRRNLIQQYFFNSSSTASSIAGWVMILIKQGNGFFLKALADFFTSVTNTDRKNSSNNGDDGAMISFLQNIIPDCDEVLSIIAECMEKNFIFYLSDRETIIAYLQSLHRLDCLATGVTEFSTNLLDGSLYYKHEVYTSFAHFMVSSAFFKTVSKNGNGDEGDDDNEDGNGDNESVVSTFAKMEFQVRHWLEIFLDDLHLDLTGKHVDIDNYCLPLISYAINMTNFPNDFILKIVKFLVLEAKVDINANGSISDGNDQLYVTPLCLAVFHRNLPVINFLLKNGANTTGGDHSPLLFILQKEIHQLTDFPPFSLKILKKLLQAGADIDEYKSDGYFDRNLIYEEAVPLLSLDKKRRKNEQN